MLIFVDCETTGLSENDSIIQLAIIKADINLEIIDTRNYFFAVSDITEEAQQVHGYTVDLLKDLSNNKSFQDQAEEIYWNLLHPGYYYWLISHNARFDYHMLKNEFNRVGYSFKTPNIFCTMEETTELCAIPRSNGNFSWLPLEHLQNFFQVSNDYIKNRVKHLFGYKLSAHDARFDVTCLYKTFKEAVTKNVICLENGNWVVYFTPERREYEKELEELRQMQKKKKKKPSPAKNVITASQAKESGLPCFKAFQDVPPEYVTKTQAKRIKHKVKSSEKPAGYVLSRLHNGYLPLYKR